MFRKTRLRPDGATDGDHGEAKRRIEARLGGKAKNKSNTPASEEGDPDFPDALAYLWAWFWEILDGIAPNGMAPVAFGWRDLAAWCELTGARLDNWEARLLVRLSGLRTQIVSEAHGNHNQNRAD